MSKVLVAVLSENLSQFGLIHATVAWHDAVTDETGTSVLYVPVGTSPEDMEALLNPSLNNDAAVLEEDEPVDGTALYLTGKALALRREP